MAFGKKTWFSPGLFSYPTWAGRAQVWLERVDCFFRYSSVLMHNSNLLSNMGAELLDSVIIVSVNKLELLLQEKQLGRQDKTHFSLWGFSSEFTKPYPWLSGVFFALFAAVALQKTLIFGWIQNLGIQTQFSALSFHGKEEQERKRTGHSPPPALSPDLWVG